MNYEEIFTENRNYLWGLCYRMTGSASDAEDLVQETFIRALEHPPERTEDPWRPWLVKVAMNLSRDHLRHRQTVKYTGPWLPSPINTATETEPPSFEPNLAGQSTEARYELLESVSFAFLLALEALSPAQRAVLLLRDVFDYSVRDVADAIAMSEANVKVTHHRARAAMEAYEERRRQPTRALQEQTLNVLTQFLSALVEHDSEKMESLLAEDVRAVSDGGGRYLAALKPILGRDKVLRFMTKLAEKRGAAIDVDFRLFNGMPAVVIETEEEDERLAPVFVLRCDLAPDGRIAEIHTVLAPDKLMAIRRGHVPG